MVTLAAQGNGTAVIIVLFIVGGAFLAWAALGALRDKSKARKDRRDRFGRNPWND